MFIEKRVEAFVFKKKQLKVVDIKVIEKKNYFWGNNFERIKANLSGFS
jgi:hypothetical protein